MPSPFSLRALVAAVTFVITSQALAEPIPLNLPAQPLATSLRQLGEAAKLTIAVDSRLTAGRNAPAVHGAIEPLDALAQLLSGSGLNYQQSGNTLVISRASTDAVELGATSISGSQLGATSEGTGSYTTGSTATATKLALTPRETPQSVTVITRQQMDDQGLTSVAKALEHSVGVTLNQAETDRVFPIVRGFNVTNIQYDGIPSAAGGSYDDDLLVDSAIYDRIEIVRGATGLMSGVGEPSAAINLVRKRPTSEFQGYVLGGAGTWDNYRSEVDVSGPLVDSGALRGRFVGAYQDRNSYMDAYSNARSVLYGIIEADITDSTLLSAGLDYQKSQSNGMTYGEPVTLFYADGGKTNFSRSITTGNDWTYLDKERLISFASLEQQFANGWSGKVLVTHVDGDLSNQMIYSSGYPDRVTGAGVSVSPNSFDSSHTQNALDLYATGPFTLFQREHELVLGWSYNQDKTDRDAYPVLSIGNLDNFYDWNSFPSPVWSDSVGNQWGWESKQDGAYLAARLQLADPLKLIIGSRLSNAEYTSYYQPAGGSKGSTTSKYSGELTPYAGLIYEFAEHYSAYLSYTDIFQTQTMMDRNGQLLDPLLGSNYELGVKGEFYDGRLNLSATVFKVNQDNLAVEDVMVNGEQRYKAMSGTEVLGYELEISGELLPGWQVAGGFTHRNAEDADGNAIQTLEPEDLLRLTSSYRLPGSLDRLTLGGHVTWQSRIYTDNVGPNSDQRAQQSDYSLLDLFGTYKIDEHLSTQLNLNNVFDKHYYKSVGYYGGGYYGEPRNLMATLKYQF